jgi:hypothetical protein
MRGIADDEDGSHQQPAATSRKEPERSIHGRPPVTSSVCGKCRPMGRPTTRPDGRDNRRRSTRGSLQRLDPPRRMPAGNRPDDSRRRTVRHEIASNSATRDNGISPEATGDETTCIRHPKKESDHGRSRERLWSLASVPIVPPRRRTSRSRDISQENGRRCSPVANEDGATCRGPVASTTSIAPPRSQVPFRSRAT